MYMFVFRVKHRFNYRPTVKVCGTGAEMLYKYLYSLFGSYRLHIHMHLAYLLFVTFQAK